MTKLIKCISLFLSIVTASVSLVSCNVEDVSGTASESSEIIVSETEMLIETDQLPDITSKNYEDDFLLWIMKDTNQVEYHWVDESQNDVLSQAIYDRQQKVYDYLGVNIIGTSVTNYQEYATPFKTAIKNKDGSVDTMLCHVYASVPSLVSENYLSDISCLSGIDVNADYWNQEFMEDLMIDGRYYLGFSDFNILYTHVITFNKILMEQYAGALEKSVYDMVRDKEWTVDELISLANLVYIDQTANGKSVDDTFGITGLQYNEFTGFLHGAEIKLVELDVDGQYKVALLNETNKEKTSALVDKLRKLSESDCSCFDYGKVTDPSVPITTGRTLMHLNRTAYLVDYLNYDISFGVLPYPLWDSNQNNYHHLQWGGYISVPAYLKNEEMVSETLEMISYYSADVKLAYYEKMLGKRVADVPDDSEMLSIVWKTVCADFAQTYCQALGGSGLIYVMADVTRENANTNIASAVASLERAANNGIKKFMKKIVENNN